jgi:butyryl-CoA dehydrogenase
VEMRVEAKLLGDAIAQVLRATHEAWAGAGPGDALVNAVPYMQAFGHTVLAWIWLDLSCAALTGDPAQTDVQTVGKLGAARYFYRYELPKIDAWLAVVGARDRTCADLPEAAF